MLPVFAIYVAALTLRPASLHRIRLPSLMRSALVQAPGHLGHEDGAREGSSWMPVVLLPLAVVLVAAGAYGLVRSATLLAATWHVPAAIVGALVLAVLTSLPNAYAAVHLGRRGRGTAVLSEAMNSNNLNLLLGLVLPAAMFGLKGIGTAGGIAYGWLLGLTLLVLALCARGHRLHRLEAAVVIAGYLGFVAALLLS